MKFDFKESILRNYNNSVEETNKRLDEIIATKQGREATISMRNELDFSILVVVENVLNEYHKALMKHLSGEGTD